MSVLHGPLPLATLGELRQVIRDMSEVPDSTPIVVSITDEELRLMARFPDTREADGIIIDAADSGDGIQPVVIAPWVSQ